MKTDEKVRKNVIGRMLLALVIAVVCCITYTDASADNTFLKSRKVSVYAGDSIDIKQYIDTDFLDNNQNGLGNIVDNDGSGDVEDNTGITNYTVAYKWNSKNPSPDCASLSDDGIVRTTDSGTVKVDVTLTYNDTVKNEIMTIKILSPEYLTMSYGGSHTLAASDIYYNDNSEAENAEKYSYISDVNSVSIKEDGSLQVTGFSKTNIYVVKSDKTQIKVAVVDIVKPKLKNISIARAMGSDAFTPEIDDYKALTGDSKITWSTGNKKIVSLDGDKLKTVKRGKTSFKAGITANNGEKIILEGKITVTEPKFSKSKIVVASDITQKLSVKGICDDSYVNWYLKQSDKTSKGLYVMDDGVIYTQTAGTYNYVVDADGKKLTCRIIITNPRINVSNDISSCSGRKKTIKVRGLNSKNSKVRFKSKNKKVATITRNGKIRFKKIGHAEIDVVADGRLFIIRTEVSSKIGYKASMKAIAISKKKTVYSQAYRMSNGKYDCSSLVWRVYSKCGVYFGVRSGWAPTAADIGKWCAQHHKVIANKGVSYTKLLPGDLIFFSYTKNGRYKNISHVEMYTGGGMDVSASSSYNRVVHYWYYPNDSIVMIARPTK
mgnify:CR=1 FL=1